MEAFVSSDGRKYAETPSLGRFVREYFTTIDKWLAQRIRGYVIPPA
jgi:hypothetical protein